MVVCPIPVNVLDLVHAVALESMICTRNNMVQQHFLSIWTRCLQIPLCLPGPLDDPARRPDDGTVAPDTVPIPLDKGDHGACAVAGT
jgi:hypothetical protein